MCSGKRRGHGGGRKSALVEEGRVDGRGCVACTMQPVDDTDVTDRYCYFIARKSWPRILPIEGHGPSPAYLLTGVSSVALSVFPLLLSRPLFSRGASIRPPEERKEFWTNLFRLPDQERERERDASLEFSIEGIEDVVGENDRLEIQLSSRIHISELYVNG